MHGSKLLTYDDTDLNYITSASSLENWLYFLRTGAPVNFILAESNIDDTYYTTHPIEKQYIVAMLRDPKRIFFLTVNYLSDPELIQETNLAFLPAFFERDYEYADDDNPGKYDHRRLARKLHRILLLGH